VKFELLFCLKIDSQSILASFTHWFLQIRTVKTGLNSIHKLYITKNAVCLSPTNWEIRAENYFCFLVIWFNNPPLLIIPRAKSGSGASLTARMSRILTIQPKPSCKNVALQ